MAENDKKEEAAAEAPAKGDGKAEGAEEGGKKKKPLIIIAIAVVLLAAVGGGAAFFLLSGKKKPDPSAEAPTGEHNEEPKTDDHGAPPKDEHAPPAKDDHATPKKDDHGAAPDHHAAAPAAPAEKPVDENQFGSTYNFKTFHLNLGNPLENHYIRLEVAVEYKGGNDQKAEIERRLPQLRDAVVSVASRKSREFLLGPDGKEQLRRELLIRINRYMTKPVEAVYITDMLIE